MIIIHVYKFLALLLSFFDGSIVFESLESKTEKQKPVFNKIYLEQTYKRDTWTMFQSHSGIKAQKWDKIQIIVDKTKSPYFATYKQLEGNEEVAFKADCFRCHSNGPRLIRPNFEKIHFSFKDKLKLARMNSIIKSYGVIKSAMPKSPIIKLKSCNRCHNNSGIRAPITEKNSQTALFLIKNQQMPPWPHKLSKKEEVLIKEFVYGF